MLANATDSTIEGNIFLRDSNSLGRGIGLYQTTNDIVKYNHFGSLDERDKSILTSKTKELYVKLKTLSTEEKIELTNENQGYFMTAINGVNRDKNVLIQGNYFDLNEDLNELGYENNKSATDFYHRDHIIYAKGYDNFMIVGNYFKGSNKNQDGGVKYRDGQNLLIHKNILDDTVILLYVQDNNSKFKNAEVSENIFLNRVYTNEKITYTKSNSTTYTKNITADFLVLFYNYYTNADISNINIENNITYSTNLSNEKITIGGTSGVTTTISSIYVNNNKNLLDENFTTNYIGNTRKTLADFNERYLCSNRTSF